MRTRDETAEDQHARMLDALADLEQRAIDFASKPPAEWTRHATRNQLARAALTYARRVRRLAGVR